MTASTSPRPLYVAGHPWSGQSTLTVRGPYDGREAGSVFLCGQTEAERAVAEAVAYRCTLTRHERSQVLARAAALLEPRREDFARLITSETGLCIRETRYEAGRALDVLRFSAGAALEDDGRAFAGDVSANGARRRIHTFREPVACVAAITPFNHPLNTVAHKLAPAIAVGAPMILKPSEKTPLTALALADLLFEAGLPPPMLSVLLGPTDQVAGTLVTHPKVEALTFTGSTHVGTRIAAAAGYKRLALELGGNSELIVLADADLDLAARLACEGAYRNSGQRCTAAKRLLIDEAVVHEFTRRVVVLSAEYVCGDPMNPQTRVGTVIDADAADRLARLVDEAVAAGARLLHGGKPLPPPPSTSRSALFPPTVLADVPRTAEIVCKEAFGPVAKIMPVRGLDDAIALANATEYGLSSSVVTRNLDWAMRVVREVRTGNVNINEVPGYRTEMTPFGGVKMSGLGIKEGVAEACAWMTNLKTYSMPW